MVHLKGWGVHPARQLSSDSSQSISYTCWAAHVLIFKTVLVGGFPRASPGLWASHVVPGAVWGDSPSPHSWPAPQETSGFLSDSVFLSPRFH